MIEFLRWIYCSQVKLDDLKFAIDLLLFADKYLENNLANKCFSFLLFEINLENVYQILDFATEQNNSYLWDQCKSFLMRKIGKCNILDLINYLDRTCNSVFGKGLLDLKEKTVKFVVDNFTNIHKNYRSNISSFEDFLIKNIDFKTLENFVNFIERESSGFLPESDKCSEYNNSGKKAKANLEKIIVNLNKELFNFVTKNIHEIRERGIHKALSSTFWADLVVFMVENQDIMQNKKEQQEEIKQEINEQRMIQEEHRAVGQEKSEKSEMMKTDFETKQSQKRKEPVQEEEAKPDFKKTKKTFK